MPPIGTDESTTLELETPTIVLPPAPRPTPWYDRQPVLVVAGLLGAVGLIALATSVVTMSDESTQSPRPSTSVSIPAAPSAPPASAGVPTTAAAPVDTSPVLAPPPVLPSDPPPSAVFDAPGAEQNAETIDPAPPLPDPGHYRRWLRHNFPHLFGGDDGG